MSFIQVPQVIPGKENSIMQKPHIYIIKLHIFNFTKYFIINFLANNIGDGFFIEYY